MCAVEHGMIELFRGAAKHMQWKHSQ
jgi:hypothetical protein